MSLFDLLFSGRPLKDLIPPKPPTKFDSRSLFDRMANPQYTTPDWLSEARELCTKLPPHEEITSCITLDDYKGVAASVHTVKSALISRGKTPFTLGPQLPRFNGGVWTWAHVAFCLGYTSATLESLRVHFGRICGNDTNIKLFARVERLPRGNAKELQPFQHPLMVGLLETCLKIFASYEFADFNAASFYQKEINQFLDYQKQFIAATNLLMSHVRKRTFTNSRRRPTILQWYKMCRPLLHSAEITSVCLERDSNFDGELDLQHLSIAGTALAGTEPTPVGLALVAAVWFYFNPTTSSSMLFSVITILRQRWMQDKLNPRARLPEFNLPSFSDVDTMRTVTGTRPATVSAHDQFGNFQFSDLLTEAQRMKQAADFLDAKKRTKRQTEKLQERKRKLANKIRNNAKVRSESGDVED